MRIVLVPQEPCRPTCILLVGPLTIPVGPSHGVDGYGGPRPVQGNAPRDSGWTLLQLAEGSTTAAMQGAVRFWALGYCGQLGLRIIRIDRVALQSIHNSGNCNKQLLV